MGPMWTYFAALMTRIFRGICKMFCMLRISQQNRHMSLLDVFWNHVGATWRLSWADALIKGIKGAHVELGWAYVELMLRHCMRVVCGMCRVCCMLYIYTVLAPHLQATARQAIALHDTCTMHCNDVSSSVHACFGCRRAYIIHTHTHTHVHIRSVCVCTG